MTVVTMTSPGELRCTAIRTQLRSTLAAFRTAGFVVAALLFVFAAPGAPVVAAIAVGLAVIPAVLTYTERVRKGGGVTLDAEGLLLRTDSVPRRIRRAEVEGGYLRALDRSVFLRLGNGQRLTLRLEDPGGNQRVLDHVLGLDKQALVAPLRGQLGAFMKGFLAFLASYILSSVVFASAGVVLGMIASPFLAVLVTALVVARFGYPRAVVGSDGIRITGGVRTRFIPFADVEDATASATPWPGRGEAHSGVRILRRGKSAVLLPTIGQGPDEVTGLVERIRAGARGCSPGGKERLLGVLDRRGRTPAAWKADLGRLALAGGGFRVAAVAPDELESVLDDPSATADRRVGAALALHAIDPSLGPRIRTTAAASANPKLRVALEAASEGEVNEEAIHEALAVRSTD
jgi:hypothetical protein